MYERLRRHLPAPVADLAAVIWRATLIVLVVLYSDAVLGQFQYASF
jgi:hypothetical protein